MEKTLSEWANTVYQTASDRGWHENDVQMSEKEKIASFFMNIHSEVSELWEAYREGKLNLPCDKAAGMAEPLTCLEEELADIVIRAMDSAEALGVDIERAVAIKNAYNATRTRRHGNKLA